MHPSHVKMKQLPSSISLQRLIHSTVLVCELQLNKIQQRNLSPFTQKKNLIDTLARVRFILAKLLVAFRLYKSKPYIAFGSQSNFTPKYDEIQEVLDFFKAYPLKRLMKFNMFGMAMMGYRFQKPQQITLPEMYGYLFDQYRPGRIKTFKIYGNYLYLFANPEFWATIKLDNDGSCYLKYVHINWPNDLSHDPKLLKLHLSKYYKFHYQAPRVLNNLENVLHYNFLIGVFTDTARKFVECAEEFDYNISYKDHFLYFSFSEEFQPFNKAQLYLTNDHVIFRSSIPLYPPPLESCSVKFMKSQTDHILKHTQSRFIVFNFDQLQTDVKKYITIMKDCIYYSKLRIIFRSIKMAIIIDVYLKFYVEMVYNSKHISQSYLNLGTGPAVLCTIRLDGKNGEIKISPYNTNAKMNFTFFRSVLYQGPVELSMALDNLLMNSVLEYAHYYVIGPHNSFLEHAPINFKIEKLTFVLSYSTDIKILLEMHPGKPNFRLISNFQEIQMKQSAKSIELMHSKAIRGPEIIIRALNTIKILLIVTDLAAKLSQRGFICSAEEHQLTVLMKPFMRIFIKFYTTNYWVMKFQKTGFPVFPGSIFISGRTFGARFVDYLVNILVQVITIGNYYLHTFNQASIIKKNDMNFMVRLQSGYYINFHLSPLMDFIQTTYRTYYFVHHSTNFHISHRATGLSYHEIIPDEFGAFLNWKHSSIIKLENEFFDKKDWSLTQLSTLTSFYLVYNKNITLSLKLQSDNSYAVAIPSFGISSYLEIPMQTFPYLYKTVTFLNKVYRVTAIQFTQMRTQIETFYTNYNTLLSRGFEILKNTSSKMVFSNNIEKIKLTHMGIHEITEHTE